jgi:sigma-54-specific transcriptional regulator
METSALRVFADEKPRPQRGRNAFGTRNLLSFPDADAQTLSIRAKALAFSDPRSARLLDHIERIARSDASALIVGETGTGKELVARHIHACSERGGPFVAVNCGAFSETLIEAELFGHEAGVYTGATQARPGWFEAAQGGTLFLDEIGDLPLAMQVKLLRVLQERQVVRLGSRQALAVDVRVIAATNVELTRAIEARHFRADLFYRLNVATIALPPLRERSGDILPIAEHFAARYGRRLGFESVRIGAGASRALLAHDWPGNIRELENAIHFALIVCCDGVIEAADLNLRSRTSAALAEAPTAEPAESALFAGLAREIGKFMHNPPDNLFRQIEKLLVGIALRECGGNQVHTARLLGISRNTLRTLLRRDGLN